MVSLTVMRTICNYRTGFSKTVKVFHMHHESSRVANNILELLSNSQSLEGGDVVICKRNNKVVRRYTVCMICCKRPVNENCDRCEECTDTISSAIAAQLAVGKCKNTKTNTKKKPDAKAEMTQQKTESYELFPPRVSLVRECFR